MTAQRALTNRLKPLQVPPQSSPRNTYASSSPLQCSGLMSPPETPSRLNLPPRTSQEQCGLATPPSMSKSVTRDRYIPQDGMLEFRSDISDYQMVKEKRLGSGRFSSVYIAHKIAALPDPIDSMSITPPTTPTMKHGSRSGPDARPAIYAIKVAADKSSVKTIKNEARILSRLASDIDCENHLVPFHGFDGRHNTLVFTALPATLSELITSELEFLDATQRNEKLLDILPGLCRSLTACLAWMHSLDVIHADLKPTNILLSPDAPIEVTSPRSQSMLDIPFKPVLADFTSSFLSTDDAALIARIGGGTYDYMAPELLTKPFPSPNFKSDVYAMAVTLLELVIGVSPFQEANGNRIMKIAMIKQGDVLDRINSDIHSQSRFELLEKGLESRHLPSLDILLGSALRSNPNERLDALQWSQLLDA